MPGDCDTGAGYDRTPDTVRGSGWLELAETSQHDQGKVEPFAKPSTRVSTSSPSNSCSHVVRAFKCPRVCTHDALMIPSCGIMKRGVLCLHILVGVHCVLELIVFKEVLVMGYDKSTCAFVRTDYRHVRIAIPERIDTSEWTYILIRDRVQLACNRQCHLPVTYHEHPNLSGQRMDFGGCNGHRKSSWVAVSVRYADMRSAACSGVWPSHSAARSRSGIWNLSQSSTR